MPPNGDLPKDKLTEKDLELIKERPASVRGWAAKYITIYYRDGQLKGEQSELAEKLFANISKEDKDSGVKKTLAEELKEFDDDQLHGIVIDLSNDKDAEVAGPLLADYKYFTKDEINGFIEGDDNKKKAYIARRKDLDRPQSAILIGTNEPDVVRNLLENANSKLEDEDYTKVLRDFPEHEEVLSALLGRDGTPGFLVVRAVEVTTNDILASLYKKHQKKFEKEHIEVSVNDKGSVAKLKVPVAKQTDIVFERMNETGVDVDFMPFLALCMGFIEIFEHTLVRQANIDVDAFLAMSPSFEEFSAHYKKSEFDDAFLNPSWAVYSEMKKVYLEKTVLPREIYKTTKDNVIKALESVDNGNIFIDLLTKAYD